MSFLELSVTSSFISAVMWVAITWILILHRFIFIINIFNYRSQSILDFYHQYNHNAWFSSSISSQFLIFVINIFTILDFYHKFLRKSVKARNRLTVAESIEVIFAELFTFTFIWIICFTFNWESIWNSLLWQLQEI